MAGVPGKITALILHLLSISCAEKLLCVGANSTMGALSGSLSTENAQNAPLMLGHKQPTRTHSDVLVEYAEEAKAGEGSRMNGVMKDGTPDRFYLQGADDLKDLKASVSVYKPVFVPGRKKISGWEDRDDPIANGALDDLDWTKHKVVVAVGCSIVSTEDKDGTLSVELKSATSGHDRQYEALVVATEASECSWEGGERGFGGDVMQRPIEQRPLDMGPMMIEQRPLDPGPMMLEQRPVEPGPMMMEQRPADDAPFEFEGESGDKGEL